MWYKIKNENKNCIINLTHITNIAVVQNYEDGNLIDKYDVSIHLSGKPMTLYSYSSSEKAQKSVDELCTLVNITKKIALLKEMH